MKKWWYLLMPVIAGLTAVYFGCGGGGGSSLIPSTPGIPYLFMIDNSAGSAGTLYAVDPSNPTQPIIVTDRVSRNSCRLVFSRITTAGQPSAEIIPYALVFAKDGRLFRVDRNLIMKRISTEGSATGEGLGVSTDMNNVENSMILYGPAGSIKAVRLGMDNSVDPIVNDLTGIRRVLSRVGNASVDGWIVQFTDNTVEHCDRNFENCSFIKKAGFDNASVIGRFPSGDILLKTDAEVFIYYPAPRALSGLVYTFVKQPGFYDRDFPQDGSTSLYFPDGGDLLKVENAAYGTLPKLTYLAVDSNDNSVILNMFPTTGQEIFYLKGFKNNPFRNILYSVSKSGPRVPLDAGVPLDETNGSDNTYIDEGLVGFGSRVYYNIVDNNFFPPRPLAAVHVFSDNTNRVVTDNAYWSGLTLAATGLNFDNLGDISVERLFQVQLNPDLGNPVVWDNATVISYRAATNDDRVQVGVLKAEDPSEILALEEFKIVAFLGQHVLGSIPVNSITDVYYLDAEKADSLRRVLKTPGLEEMPVSIFD